MRSALRTIAALALSAMLFCLAQPLHAQNPALEQSLKAQFTLTKMTADKSDILTAGSVLDLHKDGLQMCGTDAVSPITTTYKNGKLSAGFGSMMLWSGGPYLPSFGKCGVVEFAVAPAFAFNFETLKP